MSYVKGENRHQLTLMPEVIDGYITEGNQVRFIEAFVESLELTNFQYGQPKQTGRPSYNPKDMLKLYIYGYLNNIRSSRKLERIKKIEEHINEYFEQLDKNDDKENSVKDFNAEELKEGIVLSKKISVSGFLF